MNAYDNQLFAANEKRRQAKEQVVAKVAEAVFAIIWANAEAGEPSPTVQEFVAALGCSKKRVLDATKHLRDTGQVTLFQGGRHCRAIFEITATGKRTAVPEATRRTPAGGRPPQDRSGEVYAVLCEAARNNEICPSAREIAKRIRSGDKTVFCAIKQFEADGRISVQRRSGRVLIVTITETGQTTRDPVPPKPPKPPKPPRQFASRAAKPKAAPSDKPVVAAPQPRPSFNFPAHLRPTAEPQPEELRNPVGCLWIDGRPDTKDRWRYCQAPKVFGRSWCHEHYARVYRPLHFGGG